MHHSEDVSSETFEYPLIPIIALDIHHAVFQIFCLSLVWDSITKYDCCHGDHTEYKVTILSALDCSWGFIEVSRALGLGLLFCGCLAEWMWGDLHLRHGSAVVWEPFCRVCWSAGQRFLRLHVHRLLFPPGMSIGGLRYRWALGHPQDLGLLAR